jgi:two-component system chemotaxis sensor kinase CheA
MLNRDFFITHFKDEANDHIQGITQRLFQLEEQSGDQKQLLEEVLRIAHTLKGSARMMGYHDISTLAHKMEDLFVEIRDGHLELFPKAVDLVLYCLDTINYLVEGMYKNVKRTANIEELVTLFNDLIAGKDITVPQLPSQPVSRPSGEVVATVPPKPEVSLEQISEAKERQFVRVHTEDLDAVLNLVGEVLMNQYRYDGQFIAFQDMMQVLRDHRYQVAALQATIEHGDGQASSPQIANMSANIARSAAQAIRKTRELIKKARTDGQQMHLAINKLQEHVIGVRMVPSARIFHLFPRLLRVTARRLGKVAELVLLGEETKVDSRIIEDMRDPLIHLIQNAIRHGIETPEERQRKGKKPTGTITVSAYQEGNRIVIRVQDDGKGIDVERIRTVAVERGIFSQKDMRAVSDQDLYELLFKPGFSTSETVDDIAGRGFGLDIVRARVDGVQGEIEVRSRPGQGAEFVIKLPLTLTIINALLVRVADEIFALPTTAIEKTLDIQADELEHLGAMSVIALDGTLLPVVALRKILDFPTQHPADSQDSMYPVATGPDASRQTVIVIQSEDRRIGFLVDDLVEEREIVVKPLGSCLKRVKNIAGATTVREDVIMILFVRDLVHAADLFLAGAAPPTFGSQVEGGKRNLRSAVRPGGAKILILDDSLNTREVERTILEEAGYDVATAGNGLEGLEHVRRTPVDLVIADVEMPAMDGFEFISRLKQDERLQQIPVIIVSTRGSEADRQQGLNLGAQAYIVKGEFDEQILLHTIDACLNLININA